eukprot:TCONS_00073399-protein
MRISKADKIEVKTKSLYNGRKRSIQSFSSQVHKLGIASLKAILFHHNLPTRGTKDEIVLNVCLLKEDSRALYQQKLRFFSPRANKKDQHSHLSAETFLCSPFQKEPKVCHTTGTKYFDQES